MFINSKRLNAQMIYISLLNYSISLLVRLFNNDKFLDYHSEITKYVSNIVMNKPIQLAADTINTYKFPLTTPWTYLEGKQFKQGPTFMSIEMYFSHNVPING